MDKAQHKGIAYLVGVYSSAIPHLKWPEIKRARYWYTGWQEDGVDADSLMMLFVDDRSGASIETDADGDVRIRYDVDTGDVAGMEIDDFEGHFLKKHPELAAGWAALKPAGKGGFHNTPWLADELAVGYARRLRDMAYQGTVTPGWPFEDLESIADGDGSFRRRLRDSDRRG